MSYTMRFAESRYDHHPFTFIELLFALSLLTLGFFGITTIISVGLDAGKDAISKSIATDAAEQFLHFNSSKIREDWTWSEIFPQEKPEHDDSHVDVSTVWGWSKEALFENDTVTLSFATQNREEAFDPEKHVLGYFLYSLQTKEYEKFEISIRAWKNVTDLGFGSKSVVLHAEVSYPAHKPYSDRYKQVFSLEMFKIPEIQLAVLP